MFGTAGRIGWVEVNAEHCQGGLSWATAMMEPCRDRAEAGSGSGANITDTDTDTDTETETETPAGERIPGGRLDIPDPHHASFKQ